MDALRRALQGPASTLAAGATQAGGSFTVTVTPNSITAPGGVANSYQATIDIASKSGFNGLITLTEVDNFSGSGATIGLSSTPVQVTPPSPSGDALVPINVNIATTTPSGQYSITITGTSTNNGQVTKGAAVLGVFVGTASGPCVNNNDCGTGLVCSGGKCYSPVDNTLVHQGPCVARDTSICKGETGTVPCTGPDGNCYCASTASNCQSQDCSKLGPCSAATLLQNCVCGCTKCQNAANPISLACPGEIDSYNIGASNSATGSFTLTNSDSLSGYNVDMSLIPVGTNCLCCGVGPSLSTGGGYSIGPGGVQATSIVIPTTCTTLNQCYQWNLKVTVSLAISGTAIQSFTCPVKFCMKPCATLTASASISFSGAPANCCPTDCSSGTPSWWGAFSITDQHSHSGTANFQYPGGPIGSISGVTMIQGDAITINVCNSTACWPRDHACFAPCGNGTECELIATVTTNIGNSATFPYCTNGTCGSGGSNATASGKWCPYG